MSDCSSPRFGIGPGISSNRRVSCVRLSSRKRSCPGVLFGRQMTLNPPPIHVPFRPSRSPSGLPTGPVAEKRSGLAIEGSGVKAKSGLSSITLSVVQYRVTAIGMVPRPTRQRDISRSHSLAVKPPESRRFLRHMKPPRRHARPGAAFLGRSPKPERREAEQRSDNGWHDIARRYGILVRPRKTQARFAHSSIHTGAEAGGPARLSLLLGSSGACDALYPKTDHLANDDDGEGYADVLADLGERAHLARFGQ